MTLASLAFRNAFRRWRRYGPALANLTVFGLAFTMLTGVGDSFLRNLESRALVYYGGQGTLLTYRQGPGYWDDTAREPQEIQKLTVDLPWVTGVSTRHVYRQPGTDLVSPGKSARLRLVVGSDPVPALADRWDLVDGVGDPGAEGVVVPRSLAKALGVEVGQRVTLSLRTYTGQRNTVPLRVSGIFRDDPVFGRGVVYVDRRALNRWSGKPEHYGSENVVQTSGPFGEDRREALQQALAREIPFWAHPADKKAFLARYPTESWEGPKSVLFSLSDHTKDLTLALAALRGGLTLVALLLLVVAALGMGSTLRILLQERVREIGTLGALGMGRGRIFRLLLLEVEMVVGAGVFTGVVGGYLGLAVLSAMTLDQYPLIEPLLIRGGLGYHASAIPGVLAMVWSVSAVYLIIRPLLTGAVNGPPARSLGQGQG